PGRSAYNGLFALTGQVRPARLNEQASPPAVASLEKKSGWPRQGWLLGQAEPACGLREIGQARPWEYGRAGPELILNGSSWPRPF
ncbi:hypothetical protein TorRG33x02_348360, partial [Trema orientale]